MNTDARHFFLRDKHNRRVACVAYRPVTACGGTLTGFEFAVSTWNTKEDEFNVRYARGFAYDRLNFPTSKEAYFFVEAEDGDHAKTLICAAIVSAINYDKKHSKCVPSFPQRARDGAQRWIDHAQAVANQIANEKYDSATKQLSAQQPGILTIEDDHYAQF